MAERRDARLMHSHRLSLTVENAFGRGEILDWCRKGLRISSAVPLRTEGYQSVHLHALQDKGLSNPLELWDRTGKVRWATSKDDEWQAGIELDEPITDLKKKCEEIDFCYLFFTGRSFESQKNAE
ncbi:MAG: hypothetical protein HQM13_19600 [SAR324 cluster bacterium]|nr:hypothetical protein [SAR324 cluster bacterium]